MDDYTRKTVHYYNRYGNAMESRMIKRDYTRLYDLFCAKLPSGMILDIGCGTGRHMAEFARRGFVVSGIEPSELLREQANQTGLPVYDATIQTLPDLRLPPLAGIWCAAVLHHIAKQEAFSALRQFYGALTLGGKLFLSVRQGDWSGWEKHDDTEVEERFIQSFGDSELTTELESRGFTIAFKETEQSYWSKPLPWLNCIAVK